MSDRYPYVVRALMEQPWAITPAALDTVLGVVQLRLAGDRLSAEDIQARVGGGPPKAEVTRVGNVAVVPLHGVMVQRANLFTDISGAVSTELFGRDLRAALADPEVAAVVVDVDSPGGSAFGVEELAQTVYQARVREDAKPIVAIANSLAASAAYWVAAQADQVVASPGSQVGSIGIFTVHKDTSKADEIAGEKYTLLKSGRHKASDFSHAELSDEARSVIQASLDEYYDLFVRAVARGRGVSPSAVRSGFGEGAVVAARPALAAGMVDRIESLSDVITRLSSPQGRRAARAQAAPSLTAACEATPQEPTPATGQELSDAQLDAVRLRLELDSLTL